MTTPISVNEPVVVQARFLEDGQIQPRPLSGVGVPVTSPTWDASGKRYVSGVIWRCYLVRTPNAETFELRLDMAGARWVLERAWLDAVVWSATPDT